MAKKKSGGGFKLVNLALFILGILIILVVIFVAGFKIWIFTWQTYKNEEFGFSFRYPSRWHIVGSSPTKSQVDRNGLGGFYVDSKEKLPFYPQDPVRSQGDVQLSIYTKPNTFLDDRIAWYKKYQDDYETSKEGDNLFVTNGYDFSFGVTSEGIRVYSNELIIESDKYTYHMDTLTYGSDKSIFSDIQARFYHLIGLTIIRSFKFN